MKNVSRSSVNFLVSSMLAVGVLCLSSSATVIMVYTKNNTKAPMEDLKSASALLQQRLKFPFTSGEDVPFPQDRFGYLIAENSSVVSNEFSVPFGVSAYFWSDGPVTFEKAFKAHGSPVAFEQQGGQTPKKVMDNGGLRKVELTQKLSIMRASLNGRSLHLNYTLSKAGPLSVQVFGMNGQTLGRWNWNEISSGLYAKDVELSGVPKNSMLFVHWRSGNAHFVQKVIASEK